MKTKVFYLLAVAMLDFSTFHEVEAATTPEPVPTEVIVVVDEIGESTIYSSEESTEALSKTETSEEAIMELESMAHFAPACISARSEKGFVQVSNNCWFDLRVKVILLSQVIPYVSSSKQERALISPLTEAALMG